VDIQTPGFRRIQNGLGQDQTIGHNNSDIRVERCKLRLRFGGFQRNGVTYQQPQSLCPLLNRAGAVLFASPRRARRLAIDGGDFVAGQDQRIQHWH